MNIILFHVLGKFRDKTFKINCLATLAIKKQVKMTFSNRLGVANSGEKV